MEDLKRAKKELRKSNCPLVAEKLSYIFWNVPEGERDFQIHHLWYMTFTPLGKSITEIEKLDKD